MICIIPGEFLRDPEKNYIFASQTNPLFFRLRRAQIGSGGLIILSLRILNDRVVLIIRTSRILNGRLSAKDVLGARGTHNMTQIDSRLTQI